jgi:hypothetical protein
VHKSGVKIVRKTSLTYSFEKIQKLNVARLNKFGFSKVPSCDTLCKSCYHISGRTVEWILVHRHLTCNSENPLILAPLIIFQKNLTHKSCRAKKIVPKSFSNYFLTPSGSARQVKLNIKNLPLK